ncbi:hypothetical protein M9458_056391, partial [Cirrhinus mrigala]
MKTRQQYSVACMGKDRGFYSAADWSRVLTQSARWILGDVVRGVVQQSVYSDR